MSMRRPDPQRRGTWTIAAVAAGVVTLLVLILVPKWDAPWDPIESQEWGWRGVAMDTFTSARTRENPYNVAPISYEEVPDTGLTASSIYQNVEVLGDVDVGQFNRLMQAITAWVSPEQGCNYCHVDGDFASDEPYQKKVSRRMLQMVREVNANDPHVQPTQVTCYTCHRGENVPPLTWYKATKPEPPMGGIVGTPPPWVRTAENIRDFLPRRPFEDYLLEDKQITGSQPRAAVSAEVADLSKLEDIYLLMMQMSDGIGANCTFCHNSRAFYDWSQSTPKRITAWYGIRTTRRLNNEYIEPLQPVLPPDRLGPMGDPAKVDCATCHHQQHKPLEGLRMVETFPSLIGEGDAPAPTTRFVEAHAAAATDARVDAQTPPLATP